MAFVCPGVSVAQTTAQLGLVRFKLVLQVYVALCLLLLLTVAVDSAVLNLLCVVAAVAAASAVARLRMKMRVLFDIPGNAVLDVATTFVCTPVRSRRWPVTHRPTSQERARSARDRRWRDTCGSEVRSEARLYGYFFFCCTARCVGSQNFGLG